MVSFGSKFTYNFISITLRVILKFYVELFRFSYNFYVKQKKIIFYRFTLGKVMESLDDFTAASDCMATSLQLEPSCPVLPFTSINIAFD